MTGSRLKLGNEFGSSPSLSSALLGFSFENVFLHVLIKNVCIPKPISPQLNNTIGMNQSSLKELMEKSLRGL